MPPVRTSDSPPKRRVPRQERSRRRVEGLLDAAARLVVEQGVESLSTRDIAQAAGAPVASLYQYFADKEDVLLALAQRDMDEMDAQVLEDLGKLDVLSVSSVVRTTMLAFVAVYHRRRAFVEIYLRGRTNAAVHQFGREHNARVAETLFAFARDTGLAGPDLTQQMTLMAVEVGDRVFQLAFEHDFEGDPVLIEEGITMVTAYLERHATAAGLAGIPR
ncbi:AcrR family transcriptional regulator [Nocardioides ginsengisegetis]|uniref:AcrR family transcriptional regulator n=1 Tax=Nocardioides ginsengisegetis TaxID=661491 RepID=A0A7W3P805_9ACTN|nr:TetR/AcrR family transcriptional regulator [Nocardioides ginsengisegetis]MBA8801943.1 AcrR family transcriptional regulator [Nocardioides ginsengisegetis]